MDLAEYISKNLVHSLHTSERRAFRSCRRRHNIAYRQMYYPKVTPGPLQFGVAFHKAMEIFYEPMMWDRDRESQMLLAIANFVAECDSQLKQYRKLNGEPEVDVLQEFKDRKQLGIEMIKHYCTRVSPEYDKDFTPVEVEVPFEVPILSPQGEPIWCKCDQCWRKWETRENNNSGVQGRMAWKGLPVTYGGRLDMLAKDHIGRYWIFDWKTTSRMLDEGKEESFLELDDQVASYCWALSTMGIPTAGFVYVEIKKDYPRPPEMLSRPYKGRLLSTNKQNMTTIELFTQTAATVDPSAYVDGLYNDYINWLQLSGPKFHQRHQIHKNEHEIQSVGENIYLEALDMVNNPRVYPTPGRFSCPTCLYRQPCLAMNMGEDYEYLLENMFEKRTKHYYEEEQPSTE